MYEYLLTISCINGADTYLCTRYINTCIHTYVCTDPYRHMYVIFKYTYVHTYKYIIYKICSYYIIFRSTGLMCSAMSNRDLNSKQRVY